MLRLVAISKIDNVSNKSLQCTSKCRSLKEEWKHWKKKSMLACEQRMLVLLSLSLKDDSERWTKKNVEAFLASNGSRALRL